MDGFYINISTQTTTPLSELQMATGAAAAPLFAYVVSSIRLVTRPNGQLLRLGKGTVAIPARRAKTLERWDKLGKVLLLAADPLSQPLSLSSPV